MSEAPEQSGYGGLKKTYNNNFDDIGRPAEIVQNYPGASYGKVTTIPTYTDAGVVTYQNIDVAGPEGVAMQYRFDFDHIIRPEQTTLTIGGKTRVLSRLRYNGLDQVQTKFLGGTLTPNQFLQKVDYLYDAAGKLTHINTPAEAECFEGQSFCRMTLGLSTFNSPFQICKVANGVLVGEQTYSFPTSVQLDQPNAEVLLQTYLTAALDENGFLGEVSYDSVTHTIIVTNTNTSGITLIICDQSGPTFNVEECCEAGILVPPLETNIPMTQNEDLYYQKNTYTGLDITRIELASDCISGLFRNDYIYDADHRVTQMNNKIFKHPEIITGRYNTTYTYDTVGNINTLTRNGLKSVTDSIPNYGQIDDLNYSYLGNTSRLGSVSDTSGVSKGFVPQSSTFDYDNNGNVISDTGKGIELIQYNLLNLPRQIAISGEAIEHDYTFEGEKIKKKTTGPDGEVRVYLGGVEYVDGVAEAYHHGDGRVVLNNGTRFQFKIADHLGNTVVLFEDKDGDDVINSTATDPEIAEVLQRNLYYPFGLGLEGEWADETAPEMKYLYNG
ncbi:MAG: hypothetical protein AAF573_17060, partial [Bacteroidota bacterium]